MAWQIALQVVLSLLILPAGFWLWGLAMAPVEYRRLLGDRAALGRLLALPTSRTVLDGPISLPGGSGESLPFSPLIAALARARRKEWWSTCGLAWLLAAGLLGGSYLFGLTYLTLNVGLLLLSGMFPLLAGSGQGDRVLPLARILLKWHEVNPNGCQKFCREERPEFKILYGVLVGAPWDAAAQGAAGPPAQPGVEALCARAGVYLQSGDPQKAIEDCTRAIRISPENAEAHCRRGNAYLVAGELQKAMADLAEAIRLKPDLAEAYYLRACTYLEIGKADAGRGELQGAIADCSSAIRFNPNYLEAYCRRGELYLQIDEVYKARADFSQAMLLNPAVAEPYYRRALEQPEKRRR